MRVLDAPSYVTKAGHRWPPEQLAEVRALAQVGLAAPFVSQAFPYPLYHWAPFAVWIAAVALAALCVAASNASGRRAAVKG